LNRRSASGYFTVRAREALDHRGAAVVDAAREVKTAMPLNLLEVTFGQ
jgi:hypothetical protein